jgi:hypothetical protein
MKPHSRKIAGAIAYVAFLGLFVEVALQGFYYATAGDFLFRRTSVAIWAPNEYSGIFNRPNLALEHHTAEFTTHCYNNADGFRVPRPGVEYSRQKGDGTYRVMLLGPSFAYGWGVDYEQSFGAVLERELESRGYAGGKHIEILNAGVPSLSAAPHLRWYDHVGRAYQPDLVIWFIYGSMAIPNDPTMNVVADEDGYLVPRDSTPMLRVRAQAKKFATVFYGWMLWTKLDAIRESSSESAGGAVLGAGREMKLVAKFDLTSDEVVNALHFYHDLERVVRRDGTEVLVLYFPLSYAIHAEDVSRWKHLGVNDVPAQIAFDTAFTRYLNENGLPVVDATDALQRAAAEGERLYYWLDIHWTPKGNEVTAHVVADYLVDGRAAMPGVAR